MRQATRCPGFTLVEILLVVTIVAIVGMLALPRIVSATDESREGRLCSDLTALRRAIERYRVEHNNRRGPHLQENGLQDMSLFIERLTERTDPNGKLNAEGSCGPYLVKWPENPLIDNEETARKVIAGTGTAPPRNNESGWYYDVDSCLISVNSRTGALSLDAN
ncbi:MAG: type II secretion system protein [Phycisphaerae bacterium]